MKVQHVFYVVGVIFIFASLVYFSVEFLRDISREIKTILLFVSIIITFVVGEILREANL